MFNYLKLTDIFQNSFNYPGDSIRQSDPIGIQRDFIKILSESGLWKLAPGINMLKLLISSRGWPKPTDRFLRIPKLGSHRTPTLGIRISVHNPKSDRILSAGWIRSDSLSNSLTWVFQVQERVALVLAQFDQVREYFVQLLLLIFLNQSSMNRNLFNKIRFIIN
jgi:hypothetical protein